MDHFIYQQIQTYDCPNSSDLYYFRQPRSASNDRVAGAGLTRIYTGQDWKGNKSVDLFLYSLNL